MGAAIADYLPTGMVALVLGYLTYRSTRAGQKASERIQEGANRVAETQQALDAQRSIAEQYRALAEQARALAEARDKHIAEQDEQIREWRRIAWKEINDSAAQMPNPGDPPG